MEILIETDLPPKSYKWYFQGGEIGDNEDYEGSKTKCLLIRKCLPKHKGAYVCEITDELGGTMESRSAMLSIGKTQGLMLAILGEENTVQCII